MTLLSLPAQLEQWSFPKPSVRHARVDSAASPPAFDESETLEIRPDTSYQQDAADFQDRYLSSEEDLSSMEDIDESLLDFDYEDVDVVDARAVTINIPKSQPRSCDFAQLVCLIPAGKPKVVDVPATPVRERGTSSSRSSSANRSTVSSTSRTSRQSPMPAYVYTASEAGSTESQGLSLDTRSVSRSADEWSQSSVSSIGLSITRPPTAHSFAVQSARKNINVPATRSRPVSTYWPLTPVSPDAHSFLNSDPFDQNSRSSASPTIEKTGAHKRLRSISRSLSLAKIAISKKDSKRDSRIITPLTPRTPSTPASANPAAQPIKRKMVPRGAGDRAAPIDLTQLPEPQAQQQMPTRPKMIARGAAERAPPLRLPSFVIDATPGHEADDEFVPKKTLRRRKSMLGLI